jgi:hypothetical protein
MPRLGFVLPLSRRVHRFPVNILSEIFLHLSNIFKDFSSAFDNGPHCLSHVFQVTKIKENYEFQAEKIRESYKDQVENLRTIKRNGTTHLVSLREQYSDQVI